MHKSAMQMHNRDTHRTEVKPHQCQQCLKAFSSNHQLVQHIRVHTGEKPYKCSYCDRRFKQLSHVQQHTRLHTGEYQGATGGASGACTTAGLHVPVKHRCCELVTCCSAKKLDTDDSQTKTDLFITVWGVGGRVPYFGVSGPVSVPDVAEGEVRSGV